MSSASTTEIIQTAVTHISEVLTSGLPVVVGLAVSIIGFFFIWRLFKRGVSGR